MVKLFLCTAVALASLPALGAPYTLKLEMTPAVCAEDATYKKCTRPSNITVAALDFGAGKNCPAPIKLSPRLQARLNDIIPDRIYQDNLWRQYGSCTGMTQDAFVRALVASYETLEFPTVLTTGKPYSVSYAYLESVFLRKNPNLSTHHVRLMCHHPKDKSVLTHIDICSHGCNYPSNCPQSIAIKAH